MHRRAHAGADVGGARGDHTELGGIGAATVNELLYHIDGGLEAVKDLIEHGALLHAHDTEMVLLAYPDDELLIFADVTAPAVGPVGSDASATQVRVGGHILEHNVLVDELLVLCLIDEALVTRSDGHVFASKLLLGDQLIKHLAHGFLHGDTVVLGHGAG